jgi:hypothetical protein
MKKLLALLLLLPGFAYSQYDCDNYSHHTAIGLSYVMPRSVAVEGAFFSKQGIAAGIGAAYTRPHHSIVKNGENEYEAVSNSLDIFTYVGYRVFQVDYKVSAFINAGVTMGNVNSLQSFVSTKLLFPSGQKAFAIEPFYIFNRGASGKATLYIKL